MSKPKYSYDEECERLARYFLADYPDESATAVGDLAQAIQECIEDWLSVLDDNNKSTDTP